MKERHDRVLATHPTTSGLGWAAFESAPHPIDWGVAIIRKDQNAACLARFDALIERLQPSLVVLEQFDGPESHRHERIRGLYRAMVRLARAKDVKAEIYSRSQIKVCFSETRIATRYAIAKAIASRLETFAHQLPPARKIWLPDDPRMGMFNAAAVALTHYHLTASGT